MEVKQLKLIENIDYGDYMLPSFYNLCAEAAAVCFEENNYFGEAILNIEHTDKYIVAFKWKSVSQQIKDFHNDLVYAAEHGAYCVAFILIHELTDYKVIKQAKRKTGFDYWLGDREEELPFTDKARLEVSGILRGNQSQINQRIKKKEKQIEQSSELNIPAIIIVTEFSKPISKVVTK